MSTARQHRHTSAQANSHLSPPTTPAGMTLPVRLYRSHIMYAKPLLITAGRGEAGANKVQLELKRALSSTQQGCTPHHTAL
jgi:hypothetical protein